MRIKIFTAMLLMAASAFAQPQTLFHTGDESGFPYRIPAIARAANGDLIALSDRRPCGGDIGYGRVDILMRVSRDNGATWEPAEDVLVGTGSGPTTGYGDHSFGQAQRALHGLECAIELVKVMTATAEASGLHVHH